MFAQEYYFVLDRSGSMQGQPISVAKEATKLFVRSLPSGSKFNIISFETYYEKLFPSVTRYNEETLNSALRAIEEFEADFGGTEICKPLKSIFDDSSSDENLSKHIFLITDGWVYNSNLVIDLIQENNQRYTTHTFGIGDGVSTELIEECASAGLGKYYYVDERAHGLKGKIIQALEKSFDPFFYVEGRKLNVPFEKKLEYPRLKQIDKFYHGEYSTYMAILDTSEWTKLEGEFKLRLSNSLSGEFSAVTINLAEQCKIIEGDSIFKLITKLAMDDLINKDEPDEALKLSIKYQVPWKLSSFFAAKRLIDSTENIQRPKRRLLKIRSNMVTNQVVNSNLNINNDSICEEVSEELEANL